MKRAVSRFTDVRQPSFIKLAPVYFESGEHEEEAVVLKEVTGE